MESLFLFSIFAFLSNNNRLFFLYRQTSPLIEENEERERKLVLDFKIDHVRVGTSEKQTRNSPDSSC